MPSSNVVLVVIPTYEEAANIESVLTQVRASLPDARVLVVDDDSPDGTGDLAEKVGKEQGAIEVLRRAGKDGLGSAYRAGFAWGLRQGFEVLIEMDADLSHDPADLPRLVQGIAEGADLVIGSRYVPGGAIPGWPAHRAFLSRYGNRYATEVLGLPVVDATSGFRAYRASVLAGIDLENVRADGYGFQIEMAYRMHLAGGALREIPITFVDRVDGVSKMSSRIIVEALALVTSWGVRDRLLGRRRRRSAVRHVAATAGRRRRLESAHLDTPKTSSE